MCFVFSLCQVAVAVKVNTLPGEPVAWRCWPLTFVGLLLGFRLWDNACKSLQNAFLQLGTDLLCASICIYLHLFASICQVCGCTMGGLGLGQLKPTFTRVPSEAFPAKEVAPTSLSLSSEQPRRHRCRSLRDRRRRWDLSAKAANGLRLNGVELLGCQLKAGQKKLPESASVFVRFCFNETVKEPSIKSSDRVDVHTLCIRFAYILDSRMNILPFFAQKISSSRLADQRATQGPKQAGVST